MSEKNEPHANEVCDECGDVHTDANDLKDKILAAVVAVLEREGVASSPHNKRAVALLISEISLSFAFEAGQGWPKEGEEEAVPSTETMVVREVDLASAPKFIQEMFRTLHSKMPKN